MAPTVPPTRPPTTPLAETVLERLDEAYPAAADPVRAESASAYLRDQFAFLGIPHPRLRQLDRTVLAGLPTPAAADLSAVALGCWQRPEREFQYFACGYLRRYVRVGSPDLLSTVDQLVVTRSWWDTVDTLAAHTVGPLVAAHPSLLSTMDAWAVDENLWRARTAILHQLRYKERTDADRLFQYCTDQLDHKDFFIRKAIGWALREYAKTDPAAVRSYVHTHQARLSPLSLREALKHLS